MEGLILAQDERWRRALSMQVERLCEAFCPAVFGLWSLVFGYKEML